MCNKALERLVMTGRVTRARRDIVELDPDVAERLERAVRGSGKGLKATVNEALRIGRGMVEKPVKPPRFKIRAFVDGLQPGIDPDRMNQLLDELCSTDSDFSRFPGLQRSNPLEAE